MKRSGYVAIRPCGCWMMAWFELTASDIDDICILLDDNCTIRALADEGPVKAVKCGAHSQGPQYVMELDAARAAIATAESAQGAEKPELLASAILQMAPHPPAQPDIVSGLVDALRKRIDSAIESSEGCCGSASDEESAREVRISLRLALTEIEDFEAQSKAEPKGKE